MKLALLLTGHLRTHQQHFPYTYSNIIDNNECDIYVATWDCLGIGGEDKIVTPQSIALYLPYLKNYSIGNFEEYKNNKKLFKKTKNINSSLGQKYACANYPDDTGERDYWINRVIDQWYTIKPAFELIEDPDQYDLIFRLRLDTRVSNLNLLTDKDIVVPHAHPYEHIYAVRDHLAYGTPLGMKKYCALYDHAEEIYIDNPNLCAEGLLHYYLENISPEINFYRDRSLVEYKNYWIMK